MRVLVCPDKFAGTLSAPEAARAIAAGWRRTAPDDELELVPLADGGPGFVDVLHESLGGRLLTPTVRGPLGEPVPGTVLVAGSRAYVESAQACGLHLLPPDRRDPTITSTHGVGELVLAALAAGATEVVVGLGGSGTNDGGAGLLAALGARATAADGTDVTTALSAGGAALPAVAALDLSEPHRLLRDVQLVAATDVDNPLLGPRGATHGYGPQKGATPGQLALLETALARFAAAVGRRPDGKDPALALGAGAAGGLGYALLALGADRAPGIETVLTAVGLPERAAVSDLVVTGEGSLDWQSLRGKVVAGVAAAAQQHGRPCLVLAGRVEVDAREYAPVGVSGTYAIVDDLVSRGQDPQLAFEQPAACLADLATRAARTWSSSRTSSRTTPPSGVAPGPGSGASRDATA